MRYFRGGYVMKPGYFKIAITAFVLFVFALPAFAQQYPYNVDTRPVRGIMPTSDQISSPYDSIDPVSGKLRLEIPLASLPPGRGGSGFDLKMIYDSHMYDIQPTEQEPYDLQVLVPSFTAGDWHYGFNYSLE